MWNRRAELHLLFPVAAIFQHLHPAMKLMVDPQVPAWGEANRPRAIAFCAESFGKFVKDDRASTVQLAKDAHIEPLD
jgi:hypothetical protein